MREHIANCFELGKLAPFPKYRTEDKILSPTSPKSSDNKTNNPDNSWSTPKRYHFRPRNKQQQHVQQEEYGIQKATSYIKQPEIQQINQVVRNISEISVKPTK